LIQPDTLLTTTVLATPAYASPEQLRNEPITTACDIYSLGAILFDLLAGRRPTDKISAAAMFERAINETEPDRLPDAVTTDAAKTRGVSESRLRQMLTGDLATIAAKCLRPRPKDRYPTVDALIDDLKRYLAGRSVLARPQTVRYRIGKFVRRHRMGVAGAGLLTVALLSALVYAGWRQQQAVVEGRRAMRMQTFMYGLFKLANIYSAGNKTKTVPQFLALGAQKLPEYITDPADLRRAQLAIAESLRENQDLKDAQPLFQQVLMSAEAAGDVNAEVEAGAFAGDIAYRNGDSKQGQALTARALRLSSSPGVTPRARVWSELIYAIQRDDSGYRSDANLRLMEHAAHEAQHSDVGQHDATLALYYLGQDYLMRGMLDHAELSFRKTLASADAVAGSCGRAGIEGELGLVVGQRGNAAASVPILQRSYEGYVRCSGADSAGALKSQGMLAEELIQLRRAPEALAMMRSAMPAWRRLVAPGSDHLFIPLFYLAHAEVATGHFKVAERDARELLQTQNGRVSPGSRRMGSAEWMLAEALVGQGRWQEARPHAEYADEIFSRSPMRTPEAKEINAHVHQLRLEVDSHLQTP
ncbi:MAG: tetratricopeptide repeat-containing protein kinase family protein, partial [Rhodanobacter sp.]